MIKRGWLSAPAHLEQYQLLLDNSQELILFFDKKGRITGCNRRAKEELDFGEDIYQTTIDIIFKDVFRYKEGKLKIDNLYTEMAREATAYRKNQTCFPVNLRVAVKHKRKKYIGVCTALNIEEKKRAEMDIIDLKKDLNNRNQLSSKIGEKIAHELRTPLNGIMGYISDLIGMKLEPVQEDMVNVINQCSFHLSELINELIDYTFLINHQMVIEEREFNFTELIRHIVDTNIGRINEKGLKLCLYVSGDIPEHLIGDEKRLILILNHLISNAIKFTENGQISLEVMKLIQTDHEVELLFMLIDTGIGIERDNIGKLFHCFYQVDNSFTRKFGGVGLGLTISKMLIEAMNGTITGDSEINKGSTFSFTVRLNLPRKRTDMTEEHGMSEHAELSDSADKGDLSDFDYVSKKLQNINFFGKEQNNLPAVSIDISSLLENISLCIAMENWEKAERMACNLKELIPTTECLDNKEVLRLLFAIRRENKPLSLLITNEMKAWLGRDTE